MVNELVMQWPEPWEETTPSVQKALEAELQRELIQGHPLYHVSVRAIARHSGCDDVLFAVAGLYSVAVVHLSYSKEVNMLWPCTQFFGSVREWREHNLRIGNEPT